MASGSFYKYPTGNFGLYCTWSSTTDASNNQSKVTLKTYLSYYTISVNGNSSCSTSINGVSEKFTSPEIRVSSASSWTKKLINTRTATVKHNSDGTKKVTLSASYPFNGTYSGVSIGTITASATVTLDSIKTDCSAPTTFTATGVDGFDTSVKLSWSGAKSGIGNTINKYQIRYRKRATSTDDWDSWTDLTTISSTATSGNTTIDMSSKISRGHYVQFAIRTLGSAGSSYYSGWEYSSSLRRKYFTKCTAPTSFSISSSPFDKNVTLTWSGAGNGTNNTISSYHIQYCTSSDNSNWSSWSNLVSVNSTSASGNKTIDMSSKVSVGYYVKFRIRTQGNASGDKIEASDYYSGYKTSSTIQRISRCVNPTSLSATPNPFDSSVKISWSGAKGVTNNTINSYYIQYCTSTDNSTWGSWSKLMDAISSTSTSGNVTINLSSKVDRGKYIKFRIRTQGSAGSTYYPTSYKEMSSGIQRIAYTACTAPTSFSLSPNPFDKNVTLSWSGAGNGTNNTISSYHIQYCTSSDNSTWGSWTGLGSVSSTSTSGSKAFDMSSEVSIGHYVKFRIETRGSAGSDYYSEYKTSSAIKRISRCSNPTSLSATPNPFEDSVTISWSGAKGATSNTITSYYIQYCTSSDNKTWSSWTGLKTVESTETSGNVTINLSSKVDRGKYIKFRIRTQGSAGSTYYPTSYKEMSSGIQRIAYTACTAPTTFDIISDIQNNGYNEPFNSKVTLRWSNAKAGENSSISGYDIYCAVRQSTGSNLLWDYQLLASVSSTKTEGSITFNMSNLSKSIVAILDDESKKTLTEITRGYYVRFRIIVKSSAGSDYNSGEKTATYIESDGSTAYSIRRNPYTKCTAPTNIVLTSYNVDKNKTFNYIFDNIIYISWSEGQAGDNIEIDSYHIQYQTSSSKNTWGSTWSDLGSYVGNTMYNFENYVSRGGYIRFRIKTECSNDDYNSNYSSPSNAMKRVNLPPIVSSITISPYEFSNGDDVNIIWKYRCNDYETNYVSHIAKYRIYGRYLDENMNPTDDYWQVVADLSLTKSYANDSTFSKNLKSYTSFYENIKNEAYAEIAIIPYDMFGNSGCNINNCYKAKIFRYDRSGVSIGINDEWIPCQIYYGANGAWIQCDISAGVDSSWKQCNG